MPNRVDAGVNTVGALIQQADGFRTDRIIWVRGHDVIVTVDGLEGDEDAE